MPNDTIERNIKKASGDANAANYEHITYEGYGPNGTAIIVETLTDNRNRTATNVKNAFTKGNGNVGTPGCVSFMFDTKGQIVIDKEEYKADADELMMMEMCIRDSLCYNPVQKRAVVRNDENSACIIEKISFQPRDRV